MIYQLHPQAAEEHERQVAYYENEQRGLGQRYHEEFKAAVAVACETPQRPRVIHAPDIRSVRFKIFHFSIIYREASGMVQVLAVAHHRRQPGYWVSRR
ncbi:MAG: type II toxin-antitoxin system RelE/ParE family toxin [Dokdonella sp.]